MAALGIAFILQNLFLSCLCAQGIATITWAFVVDALILARILAGWYRCEQGRWWMVYCALLISSPIWMELVSRLFHKH
jgi:hypothetical protein